MTARNDANVGSCEYLLWQIKARSPDPLITTGPFDTLKQPATWRAWSSGQILWEAATLTGLVMADHGWILARGPTSGRR